LQEVILISISLTLYTYVISSRRSKFSSNTKTDNVPIILGVMTDVYYLPCSHDNDRRSTTHMEIYYVLTGLMVLMLVNIIIHNLYDFMSRMYNLLYVDRY